MSTAGPRRHHTEGDVEACAPVHLQSSCASRLPSGDLGFARSPLLKGKDFSSFSQRRRGLRLCSHSPVWEAQGTLKIDESPRPAQ